MKTTKSNLPVLLFLVINILLFKACCEPHDIPKNNSIPCEVLRAPQIQNEYIVKLNPIPNNYYINYLEIKFGTKLDIIDVCPCDSNILLINIPKHINGEQLEQAAGGQTGREGDITRNIHISIDDLAGTHMDLNPYDSLNLNPIDVEEMVVAVIDGGLITERFDGSLLNEYTYDFTEDHSGEETPKELHGTLVGKIIIEGIEEHVKLVDLQVLDARGNGSLFNVICATSYAIQIQADIINMSIGYYDFKADKLLHDYFKLANEQNIAIVSSAGNHGKNTDSCFHYPSGFNDYMFNLNNVISVTSLDEAGDSLADHSNYGLNTIGIAAYEGETDGVEGTSYAAPTVTNKIVELSTTLSQQPVDIINCLLTNPDPAPKIEEFIISGGKLCEICDCR